VGCRNFIYFDGTKQFVKPNSFKYLFTFLLAVYGIVLLRLIVFKGPADFLAAHLRHYGMANIRQGYALANFIPGKTLYYYLSLREDFQTGLQNIGGNIVLFIPCGLLLPLVFPSLRTVRPLLLAVLSVSLLCESLQLLLAIGTFDVDDLMLNLAGGWIGYLCLVVLTSFVGVAPVWRASGKASRLR
jgi:glycopeptide antibiotics resistance protein